MPVLMTPDRPSENGALPGTEQVATTRTRLHETNANSVVIGLVNNMPDAALESTERQFLELLNAAAGAIPVHLRLFSLPDVPRSEVARGHMSGGYCGIDDLWNSRLDALIVTGTEPRAPCLMDEPYWVTLTRVLEWAEANTTSTVWSCLAAHAAVLHMDGIARHMLDEKVFGIFECTSVSPHPLLTGVPAGIRIAHSRCNELQEEALAACNYTILTRSSEAGIDAFVKQRKSLFVFFQGHPEYDQRALLREYRRDIGRFLRGERETYPAMPRGYFDPVAADALARFQERAVFEPRESLLDSFPISFLESRLAPMARSSVARIYANWLSYLCARKDQTPSFKSNQRALRLLRTGASQPAQGVG
jgi:homoserine O-succinyltransferase/O-acetyltransferase